MLMSGIFTFFRLANVVLLGSLSSLGSIVDDQSDLELGVESNVRIANDMHDECVVARTRRSSELSLESLHVERGLSVGVEDGLVKGGKCEGRDSHLSLLAVGQEDVPSGRVVAGITGSKSERGKNSVTLLVLLESIEIALDGVGVLEVCLLDSGNVGASGRDDTSLDDQADQGRGNDVLFTGNLEESLGNSKTRQLSGNVHNFLVLIRREKSLADGKTASLCVRLVHKLLNGHMGLGCTLNSRDNVGGEVRELEEGRCLGRYCLDESLCRGVRGQDSLGIAVGERNCIVGLGESNGDRGHHVLGILQGLILEVDAAEVSPQKSEHLSPHTIEALQLLLVLGRKDASSLNPRLYLGQAGIGVVTLQLFFEFLASAQGGDETALLVAVLILAEQTTGAVDQDALLGHALSTVPPSANHVGKKYAKEETVDENHIFAVTFGDDELGQGDTDAETLLAIGVAVLNVVVANLLVGKSLVGLCQFDVLVVEGFDGLVLGRVRPDLVGVELERELLVVGLDLLFRVGVGYAEDVVG